MAGITVKEAIIVAIIIESILYGKPFCGDRCMVNDTMPLFDQDC
jgi:hypothetical protein